MANKTLPAAYFHFSMSGKQIPHSVNPGPQIACGGCNLLRFGSDFAIVGDAIRCMQCRAVAS